MNGRPVLTAGRFFYLNYPIFENTDLFTKLWIIIDHAS